MNSFDLTLTATNSSDAPILDTIPKESRQRLLRFPLGFQDSAMLPLEQITEILRVDVAEILPLPEMPSCVLGICNWRGEMLWVVDLDNLVGYPSLFRQERGSHLVIVMVVQVNNESVGLGVQQVNDIELHDLEKLLPVVPGLFSPSLEPLVLGTLSGCGDAVLDVKAIAQCPLWKKHY
jgi:positive phototaxis protein PixI